MDPHSDLPLPDEDALAHSQSLAAVIREQISSAGGWIDFADYMNLALYAPGLGYYSAGTRKFGAGGDFVTAPEISPLFSQCIGRALAEALSGISGGVILELGAGTGAMAAEILRVLEAGQALPDRYLILEVSADLRQRQDRTLKARMPSQAGRVEWLDELPHAPIDGVILANEVLDALPVTCFLAARDDLHAVGVGIEGPTFCWQPAPPSASLSTPLSAELRERVRAIEADLGEPFPAGYRSELSPSLPAFIGSLAGSLNRGLILLCDYGLPRRELYHRDRWAGTLTCHYRHRAHANPFLYPGLQDITAWVDFTAVAEAATAAGLEVSGYTTQAQFLLAAGLPGELREDATDAGLRGHLQRTSQIKALMMPGEMGERFKVIGLARGIDTLPAGFSGRDLRHLL